MGNIPSTAEFSFLSQKIRVIANNVKAPPIHSSSEQTIFSLRTEIGLRKVDWSIFLKYHQTPYYTVVSKMTGIREYSKFEECRYYQSDVSRLRSTQPTTSDGNPIKLILPPFCSMYRTPLTFTSNTR
ncbi:hypothetical protein TNCV_2058901 [Trichonephila clavipes]|nr:hypothetical protein TNCV_2058901 [Trichonephila clavipes]